MHAAVPSARFDIASFGELLSDPSRVAMLLSLMDGQARPASELARIAGVAPSTASSHLACLLDGRLVLADRVGRHRYFRLAGAHVAEALEGVSVNVLPRRSGALGDPVRAALSRARTCYKHLAGRLGVDWMDSLERQRFLGLQAGALGLTARGVACFEDLGLSVPHWPTGKSCLDWTERRNHLGGALGALLTQHLLSIQWIAKSREGRALRITPAGRSEFARFGISRGVLSEVL
jgi:DNA-binding transcriptional ArsR family regulator